MYDALAGIITGRTAVSVCWGTTNRHSISVRPRRALALYELWGTELFVTAGSKFVLRNWIRNLMFLGRVIN